MHLNFPIHHIAIIVSDLEEAVTKHKSAFEYEELPRETIEAFQAEVAFLYPKGMTTGTAIEILSPTSTEGSLARFLKTRGEGLHHICYEVEDIQKEHKRLAILGYQFIDSQPRQGAHNSLVMFIHPKSCNGVLTEIRQSLP